MHAAAAAAATFFCLVAFVCVSHSFALAVIKTHFEFIYKFKRGFSR